MVAALQHKKQARVFGEKKICVVCCAECWLAAGLCTSLSAAGGQPGGLYSQVLAIIKKKENNI